MALICPNCSVELQKFGDSRPCLECCEKEGIWAGPGVLSKTERERELDSVYFDLRSSDSTVSRMYDLCRKQGMGEWEIHQRLIIALCEIKEKLMEKLFLKEQAKCPQCTMNEALIRGEGKEIEVDFKTFIKERIIEVWKEEAVKG